MSNTLEISNLSKNYTDFKLDNVSFTLPSGFIMGMVGPNGSGKTTIIKAIMNLVMKDSGSINIFGMDHRRHEVEVKQRIGFVYDNPNFYEHLNLTQLKGVVTPFYKNWDDSLFADLTKRLDLPLNKTLKKFSKGMAMKSSIAIALSHHADFIIMDEPTSGLDPVVRREVLDIMRELIQDEGKSILFSSHITTDIEQIADYISFISNGKLIFSKTKDEVMEQHAIVKGGNELLNEDTKKVLLAIRSSDFGFEGLTNDLVRARSVFGNKAIYDKASLEDIMFYNNLITKA